MPPMANKPRGNFRSRLGQLNPAFAAAHNIASPPPPAESESTVKNTVKTEKGKETPVLPISPSPVKNSPRSKTRPSAGLDQATKAIERARISGKLQVSDAGLETPLPRVLFEFPSLEKTVDVSLDANPKKLKPWELNVAETLALVDFSDNEGITSFPTLTVDENSHHTSDNCVERYRSVQIFRARRCSLQRFPITPTMQESWQQLLTLDLSGNKLNGEFALLHLPKTIRELDLSGNRLSSLKSSQDPSASIDLPHLASLDISMNEIASTGISPVMHVPCLQRINVGNNQIFNLNFILKCISSCEKSLTTLHAPKSLLSDLDGRQPIDLTNFLALLSVDLSGNSLCCVPKIPFALQRLNVNENEIQNTEALLEKGATGSSLVVLQLQRNKLKTLDPEIIVKLTQLNRLDLQFNALSSLPLELGELTNLQQMFLEGNNLNLLRSSGIRGDLNDTKAILMRLRNRAKANKLDYSDSFGAETVSSTGSGGSGKSKSKPTHNAINVEMGGLLSSLLVGTKVLNYEGKHAHMLPFQLLEELKTSSPDIVTNIERFNVAKNQLQTIEKNWFALLPQLTILEAQDNRLNSLPANIRELAFSQILLSRNSLTSHAVQFSILMTSSKSNMLTDTLQTLDLSSNHLDTFAPELLRHFKSLRHLNLSRNRITSLQNIVDAPYPPSCRTLEHFDLSENQIEHLGGDDFPLLMLVGCPKLQSLRLENNEVEMIPMTLGLLENLKSLDLRGNPQRMIRYDILDKSTSDVLQYMRNRMTSKTKVMVRHKLEELRNSSLNNSGSTLVESPADPPAVVASREEDPPPTSPSSGGGKMRQTSMPSHFKKEPKVEPPRTDSKEPTPVKSNTTPSSRATTTPTKAHSRSTKIASPVGYLRASRIPTPKSRQGLSPKALGGNSPSARPCASATKGGSSNSKDNKMTKSVTSPLLEELERNIEELQADFDRPGLSEPKRYAIKKKLAMERSKRLREERRLKQEQAHSGLY